MSLQVQIPNLMFSELQIGRVMRIKQVCLVVGIDILLLDFIFIFM